MKYVRSLLSEPPLLKQYCTNHPNELQRPLGDAGTVWANFKANQPAYDELVERLREAQHGLCIYCEQRLVDEHGVLVPMDYQVEHVIPKTGMVGQVLNWMNFALACCGGTYPYHQDPSRIYTTKENISCGQQKDSRILSCDPRKMPLLAPLVKVGLDGKLTVDATHCAAVGTTSAVVDDAIKLLNLDCERLRTSRQKIGDHVRSWFTFMLEEIITTQLTSMQRDSLVNLLIASRLQPDAQDNLPCFWSSVRSAIGEPAETWLAGNQAQFT